MTASSIPTQPLRDEHRELLPPIEMLRTTADLVGTAPTDHVRANVEEAYEFLVGHLIPHATAEDRALYPVVEEAMGAPGATDTMRRDHVEVGRLTQELDVLRGHIGGSILPERELDLRRILYGLHAIVKLHFAKEEEIYLPVLDAWLDPERTAALFERLEQAAAAARAGDAR